MFCISRYDYAGNYGPTVGDRVRLGDTNIFVEVEVDLGVYGDEVKFGGGKVIQFRPIMSEYGYLLLIYGDRLTFIQEHWNKVYNRRAMAYFVFGFHLNIVDNRYVLNVKQLFIKQVIRDGMGQAVGRTGDATLDVVITSALIIDAVTGIIKADIGIKASYGFSLSVLFLSDDFYL